MAQVKCTACNGTGWIEVPDPPSGGDGALYLSGGAWGPYSIGYLLESAGEVAGIYS
jgi:hypothetical protein